jgi:hypothetical protein
MMHLRTPVVSAYLFLKLNKTKISSQIVFSSFICSRKYKSNFTSLKAIPYRSIKKEYYSTYIFSFLLKQHEIVIRDMSFVFIKSTRRETTEEK